VGHSLLLIADEPTGALDFRTGKDVAELIAGLHRRGITADWLV